ncbi:MAG: glycosyltransferase family 2 protein [Anaerolineales bacterium]|nr:glycosyltransferase family 2 protein [Anaerolineales bacterium]
MKPYLSVIIPAYNEEKRISKTLGIVYDYLMQKPFSWELLIVLDGPTDNTMDVIKTFAAGKENIRWIDRKENRGKGYTVREGMLAARGEIRLFTDADNSTDISHFDQMKPLFEKGFPVVIASRDAKDVSGAKQAVPQPFLKRFLGNAGNLFIQMMAVPGIWDTQCGFKAFSAPAARRIFSVAVNDSWVFDIEALALARRFGYKIGLVAAYWVDDANTHVKLLSYLGSLLETFKIRWDLMTGKYDRSAQSIDTDKTMPLNPKV